MSTAAYKSLDLFDYLKTLLPDGLQDEVVRCEIDMAVDSIARARVTINLNLNDFERWKKEIGEGESIL